MILDKPALQYILCCVFGIEKFFCLIIILNLKVYKLARKYI